MSRRSATEGRTAVGESERKREAFQTPEGAADDERPDTGDPDIADEFAPSPTDPANVPAEQPSETESEDPTGV
jgi:hypothetical protein